MSQAGTEIWKLFAPGLRLFLGGATSEFGCSMSNSVGQTRFSCGTVLNVFIRFRSNGFDHACLGSMPNAKCGLSFPIPGSLNHFQKIPRTDARTFPGVVLFSGGDLLSQRDFGLQPSVARNELHWVKIRRRSTTATRLRHRGTKSIDFFHD